MVSVFVVINFWNLWNSWLLYFGRLLWLAKRNAVEVFLRWKNDFVFIFTYFLMLLVGKLVPQHSVSDNVEKCVVKIHVSGGRKLKIDGAKKTRLLAENLVKLGFYAKSRKMAFNFYLVLPNSTLFFFLSAPWLGFVNSNVCFVADEDCSCFSSHFVGTWFTTQSVSAIKWRKAFAK